MLFLFKGFQLDDLSQNSCLTKLCIKPKEYNQDLVNLAQLIASNRGDHYKLDDFYREVECAEAYNVDEHLKFLAFIGEMQKTINKKVASTPKVFQRLYETPNFRRTNAYLNQPPISRENVSRIRKIFEPKQVPINQKTFQNFPTILRTIKKGSMFEKTALTKKLNIRLSFVKSINVSNAHRNNRPLINTKYRNVKSKVNSFRTKTDAEKLTIVRTSKRQTQVWATPVVIKKISSKIEKSRATWSQKFKTTILKPFKSQDLFVLPFLLSSRLRKSEQEKMN